MGLVKVKSAFSFREVFLFRSRLSSPRSVRPTQPSRLAFEFIVFVLALGSIVAAQLLLSAAIRGTTYRGPDGGMVEAAVFTAWKFGGIFNITNLNPLQGLGSQLFTKNGWINPAFWPFAVLNRETAGDISSAFALACYAAACYVMARCFDLPVVVSALAAQACIILFSPALFIIDMPRNFSPTPADAVTYAPYMLALGALARLKSSSSLREVLWISAAISVCVLYSIYCDPAFTMIAASSWVMAFVCVTLLPLGSRGILMRGGALALAFGVLTISGAAVYLYTISEYSSRVQYAAVVDRVRSLPLVTHFNALENEYYFYVAFIALWICGLVTARGRTRVLVAAAALSWVFYLVYAAIYILIVDSPWLSPIPLYVEQCLFVLFMTGAIAGAWATLHCLGSYACRLFPAAYEKIIRRPPHSEGLDERARPIGRSSGWAVFGLIFAVGAIAIIPSRFALLARPDSLGYDLYWPWASEPELVALLTDRVGLKLGSPFRGSVNFLTPNQDGTIDDLWSRGVPTLNEYSQMVSGISLYFTYGLLKVDVRGMINHFDFRVGPTPTPTYFAALQLLGVRYMVDRVPHLGADFDPDFPQVSFPYHIAKQPGNDEPPGPWMVYELPHPNLGNYSPTDVKIAGSGNEITATLSAPGFDFAKSIVLGANLDRQLVPARDVRLSAIRDGWHLSGHSDGTSLVILPQQFSHCLSAVDATVRLVRSDLLLTGVVFSGDVDTDIAFGYGIFSPWCRLTDLRDIRALDLKIDLRMPHLSGGRLFPPWPEAVNRLKTAARTLRLISP